MLAAGSSTRLGRPKQLIPFRGTTLLAHAVQTALDSGLGPVVVLLGASADECEEAIRGLSVTIVRNPDWALGMGSTIANAMRHIESVQRDAAAVLLTTCDQPHITAMDLQALDEARRSGRKPMAAAAYDGTIGIPALFSRELFADLASLTGPQGAGEMLRRRALEVAPVPCPAAAFDVDEPADLGGLRPEEG